MPGLRRDGRLHDRQEVRGIARGERNEGGIGVANGGVHWCARAGATRSKTREREQSVSSSGVCRGAGVNIVRRSGHGSRASSSARRMAAARPPWWSMNLGLPPPHIRRLASGASLPLDQHGARPGPPVGQNGLMRSGGMATTAIDDRTMMWRMPN